MLGAGTGAFNPASRPTAEIDLLTWDFPRVPSPVTSTAASHQTSLARLLPFLKWWPRVNALSVRDDALAGLIGAVVVLPQAVAFATLAGLPPEYGLYCAIVPTAVAALFGSSLHALSGPTNAVSLMVFAVLSPLATPGSSQYLEYALTLAFMSGILMIAMGMLRMGSLVNFISSTVVVGFTGAIGLLIFASQLFGFLGIHVQPSGSFVALVRDALAHLDETRPWVVVVSAFTLATAATARHWLPRIPPLLTATVAGSLLAYLLNLWLGSLRTGITTLGPLPGPIPPLSYPDLSFDTLRSLFGGALAVTLLSLTQAISIVKAVALRSGQRIHNNQEFIGQGLGNIAASFFSGFPTSASVNRCWINYDAGARTPLSGVFSAGLLVLLLFAVAPLAAFLPHAVLAGLLFQVAWGLIDLEQMRAIVRASRGETAVLVITFLSTLLLELEFAILVGVIASLVMYLHRTSHPGMRTLVPDPRHANRKMTGIEDDLKECPQLKVLRVEGSIYFGAVDHVGQHFETLREVAPEQKHLLLMCRSINFIDVAGAQMLAQEARRRRAVGGTLYFYGLRDPARDLLEHGGHMSAIGPENVFRHKQDAIASVFERLDRRICAGCRARIFLECRGLPEPLPE